ncbi:MAG: hypothetical protein VB119_07110 [Candidatus Metalachnospira sp.]|nr:hypothetical protein [Candidatus Metalachnospira sp.]
MKINEGCDVGKYTLCWLVINSLRAKAGMPVHKFGLVLTEQNERYNDVVCLLKFNNVI